MPKPADKLAHSINLLVGLASMITAEGFLAKAAGFVSAYFSGKDVFAHTTGEALSLTGSLHAKALETLAAHRGEIDQTDVPILLADMIAASLPTPQELLDQDLAPETIVKLMLSKLTQANSLPDYQTDNMKSVFKLVVTQTLTTLLNDKDFNQTLAPAINKSILTRLTDITTVVAKMEQHYGSLAKSLDDLRDLTLSELRILGLRFGIPNALDLDKPALQASIKDKADEYHALKSDVALINDSMRGLANLKAAANDAIDRLDFAEVENLLKMVHTTELETAAKTAELRAGNALMRGRATEAFDILSATADSFAAIDPQPPLTLRNGFAKILYQHGVRYGGDGLPLAAKMWRAIIAKISASRQSDLWAGAQNNLASALAQQATRTGGAQGTDLLAKAVQAYREALTVRTKADHPVDWAMTQNNLANALRNQATRTGGTQGADLMAEAVQAYREALTVYTKADHPVHWAATQNNLAVALQEQATRTGGAEGAELLAEAVQAYRAALTVRTKADHPVDWAGTQHNIAIVYLVRARHDGGDDPAGDLNRALAHVDAALSVYDPVHMPYDYEKATTLRDVILAAQAAL